MLSLYVIVLLQAVVTLLLLYLMLSMHGRVEERLNELTATLPKNRQRLLDEQEERVYEEMDRFSRLLSAVSGRAFRVRADNVRPRAESESNDEPDWGRVYRTAIAYPDYQTSLTLPHTLRECCGDDRPDDCTAWRIIAELCAELWATDHLHDD